MTTGIVAAKAKAMGARNFIASFFEPPRHQGAKKNNKLGVLVSWWFVSFHYAQISDWRSCFKRSCSKDVAELTLKKLIPREELISSVSVQQHLWSNFS